MDGRSLRNCIYFLLTLFITNSSATLLPFPSGLPSVNSSFDTILLKTWQGIKKRNIDPYSVPLVHRPKSEMPGDAVSEGVGYGMLLALYCNDQVYFNKIWDNAESRMWSGDCYNWRVNESGTVIGTGAATDAEQDIALALIFADQLVKKGVWQSHQSPKNATYANRANSIINSMWNSMIEEGVYLAPGAGWGGKSFVNPGYFAPAFYRVFDEFESQNHNWGPLIDKCYEIIENSPGYSKGLVPDWMKPDGKFAGGSLGYNSYANGEFLYKDAIRVYWRLATDYLWYGEPRAKTFLDKALNFIKTPQNANFFQMNGSAVTDTFQLGNGVTRNRTEHSHLTVGMWSTAAMGSGGAEKAEPFSVELLKFYTPGSDFWGYASDSSGEDTLHNEMYFDQFLAWFGASIISGVFTNLWEDMKDPKPGVALGWIKEPIFSTGDINASVAPLSIEGIFNKPARWNVTISHVDSLAQLIFSGSGDTIKIDWYGLSSNGTAMPQGYYDVTISARALAETVKKTVWLGKAFDIKSGSRLLVDDFRDGDLKPFIGTKWCSYLDSYEGKAGKSTINAFSVINNSGTQILKWGYTLNGGSALGYDPYAALEWNCTDPQGGNLDLTGLDTIVVTLSSSSPLGLAVQLISTTVTDYNYLQDSLQLTSTEKEFKLAIKNFKPRWNNNPVTLDLTKIKAIRFQVQNKDGTQNVLFLKRILFAGNLDKLYKSPPDYIPPVIHVINTDNKFKFSDIKCKYKNSVLTLTVSQKYVGATAMICDISGRTVDKFVLSDTSINRNIGSKMFGTKSGLYIVTIKGKAGRVVVPVKIGGF